MSHPSPKSDRAPAFAAPAALMVAALMLGAAGLCVLAALTPWLDRQNGALVMSIPDEGGKWPAATVPAWVVLASAGAVVAGGAAALACVFTDGRLRGGLRWAIEWARGHRTATVCILAAALLGSIDVYELTYEHYRTRKVALRPWMLREDLVSWLLFGATVLMALALWRRWMSRSDPAAPAALVAPSARRVMRGLWIDAMLLPLMLAAGMSLVALDGLPHFSDAVTYLLQGRLLMTGRLTLPTPAAPDLFEASIFFLHDGPRFFGKYPPAWPAILGVFDALHAAFLANAVLAGAAALLTGFLARQFLPPRQALVAALIMAASPWLWFSGADMASHVATTCAVTAALALGLRALRTGGSVSALGAGLALALAVLVRPIDAALFAALPGVVILAMLLRQPRRCLRPALLMALTASFGVVIFMLVNLATTGDIWTTSYSLEKRLASDMRFTPLSMLARFFFQCAELQQRFPGAGIGGLTLATLGAVLAWQRRRPWDLWLVVGASGVFFVVLTGWGFENVWWGPRWLLPVTPALAILISEVVDGALAMVNADTAASHSTGTETPTNADPRRVAAARFALCLALATVLTGLGRYAGQFWLHRIAPPHNVSNQVHRRVTAMGLHHAIVALPPAGARAPFDARAGLALMRFPLEANDVIYVRAVPDWRRKAEASFPGRSHHQLRRDRAAPEGFGIHRIDDAE